MFNVRLAAIGRASSRAISAFLKTEQKLAKQNAALSEVITDINDRIIELNEAKVAAEMLREDNAGIIERIGAIVRGK